MSMATMETKTANADYKPTHEQIARRARELYLASGGIVGRDTENWLAAETQLMTEYQQLMQIRASISATAVARSRSQEAPGVNRTT